MNLYHLLKEYMCRSVVNQGHHQNDYLGKNVFGYFDIRFDFS